MPLKGYRRGWNWRGLSIRIVRLDFQGSVFLTLIPSLGVSILVLTLNCASSKMFNELLLKLRCLGSPKRTDFGQNLIVLYTKANGIISTNKVTTEKIVLLNSHSISCCCIWSLIREDNKLHSPRSAKLWLAWVFRVVFPIISWLHFFRQRLKWQSFTCRRAFSQKTFGWRFVNWTLEGRKYLKMQTEIIFSKFKPHFCRYRRLEFLCHCFVFPYEDLFFMLFVSILAIKLWLAKFAKILFSEWFFVLSWKFFFLNPQAAFKYQSFNYCWSMCRMVSSKNFVCLLCFGDLMGRSCNKLHLCVIFLFFRSHTPSKLPARFVLSMSPQEFFFYSSPLNLMILVFVPNDWVLIKRNWQKNPQNFLSSLQSKSQHLSKLPAAFPSSRFYFSFFDNYESIA